MKIGKLDNDLLQRIVIDKISFRRDEVKVRPGIGEDCAVIDFGEYDCVLSTDPITAAAESIGKEAVHISCNDIASNGVQPLGVLLTVLLPPETTEEQVEQIMAQAAEAAAALGVEIIGGHTEITDVVKQPVITSTAVGRSVKREGPEPPMQRGDRVLLTKAVGIEATAIIATDHRGKVESVLTAEELAEAEAMFSEISVVTEGVIAGRIGFRAMHDVTEGGVLGAVWEVCRLHGVSAEVYKAAIPVRPVTAKVCEALNLDPYRILSSGAMLIVAGEAEAGEIIKACKEKGVEVTEIGKIADAGTGNVLYEGAAADGKFTWITPPGADEIYKL
jgi:hydrogenase expression/formation protein HypE